MPIKHIKINDNTDNIRVATVQFRRVWPSGDITKSESVANVRKYESQQNANICDMVNIMIMKAISFTIFPIESLSAIVFEIELKFIVTYLSLRNVNN